MHEEREGGGGLDQRHLSPLPRRSKTWFLASSSATYHGAVPGALGGWDGDVGEK
jgi:hypothetical protein